MSRGDRRTVMVVTSGRADYGLMRPVVRALRRQARLDVRLLVTGTHLSRRFGDTVKEIERDGLGRIADRVKMLPAADTAAAIAQSMGRGIVNVSRVFDRIRPDILLVLGDRFETLAVVAAAIPFNIVVAHIHGGERTEGAFDEAIRHAVTKMSHLHFVSHPTYARRIRQMGEEPWRVMVSGAPGLDEIGGFAPVSARALAARFHVPVDRRTLLVTYHSETLHPERSLADVQQMLRAIDRTGSPAIFTIPNADTGHEVIRRAITKAVTGRADRAVVSSLGHRDYFSLMSSVGAMVGNSSSGIIEAPSFALPVVNIGDRQRGRMRARNVIDVVPRVNLVERALRRALSPAFRRKLKGLRNPYGDGGASKRIASRLASVNLDRDLLVKRFIDR